MHYKLQNEYEFKFNNRERNCVMKSKKKIILIAAISVIAEKGYQESSIKDIADKAEISVGSIYSYFKNKQEILAEIYQHISSQQFITTQMLLKMDEYDAIHKLYATIAGMLWSYSKEPELTLILYVKSLGIDLTVERTYFNIYDKAAKGVADMINAFQKMGLCNITNADYAATGFLKVLEGMAVQWIREGQKSKIEDVAIWCIEYNCNALSIEYDLEEMKIFVKELWNRQVFEKLMEEENINAGE